MPVATSKMSCPPHCMEKSLASAGWSRVIQPCLYLCPIPSQPQHSVAARGCIGTHFSPSWQPLSPHGLWGSLTLQWSFCHTHCGLSTPVLAFHPQHPTSQVDHDNTHFPVISPCAKGWETGKEGSMEASHLIREGFLEVMPGHLLSCLTFRV